jgi:hypothetical protein
MIKKTNLRIHGVKGAEIQTKGVENLFNETIAENSPNLCNNIDTNVQEAFQTPNRHDQKRTATGHSIIKTPNLENKESTKRKMPSHIQR